MDDVKIAPAYSPLWKKVYSLIQEFIREEPWELFTDSDVFIVKSPRDDQMYLCSVMGNGGEEFGLNAFRGAQGMRSFEKIASDDENDSPDTDMLYEMDMLSFSLSPRDYMEKKDLAVTKKLMKTFPGGKWPLLRSYRPHYLPWFLTESEIEVLCDCLEQTLALYRQGDDALEHIRAVEPGKILVRHKNGSSWVSKEVSVSYPIKEEVPEIQLDDMTTQRVLKLPDTGLKEQIDLVHLPAAIYDHEPAYFGLLLMGIDEKQIATEYGLYKPFDDFFQKSCEGILQAFLSRGTKPVIVMLKNGSPFADVFEHIAGQVGIHCERADELPDIDDFVNTLEQNMREVDYPIDL